MVIPGQVSDTALASPRQLRHVVAVGRTRHRNEMKWNLEPPKRWLDGWMQRMALLARLPQFVQVGVGGGTPFQAAGRALQVQASLAVSS